MKNVLAIVALLIMLLTSHAIYAEESILSTEGFVIEDSELLNTLMDYDKNNDGVLSLDEASEVMHLNINGLAVKSLKGINNLSNLRSLEACGCELENLDGLYGLSKLHTLKISNNNITTLGDVTASLTGLTVLDLRNNKLGDINEFARLMEKELDILYISGNPFYEEAREYFFYNCDTKLNIVGEAKSTAWQKYSSGGLNVDNNSYKPVNDLNLDDMSFTIEDPDVAVITKDAKLLYCDELFGQDVVIKDINYVPPKKTDAYGCEISSYLYTEDKVAIVSLNNPGHTRMKIACGGFEKYTDIWVLEDGPQNPLLTEYEISDGGLVMLFPEAETILSGITETEELKNLSIEENTIFIRGEYGISDFTSLKPFSNIDTVYLQHFNQDSFDKMTNLNSIVNLKELKIKENDIQKIVINEDFSNLENITIMESNLEQFIINGNAPELISVNLADNNISDINSIVVPESVKRLYLSKNPLSENADVILFDKYYYTNDVTGAVDEVYEDMRVDLVQNSEIKYEIEDGRLLSAKSNKLSFKRAGTTRVKVTYKSVEKIFTVTVEGENAPKYKLRDTNKDGVISAEDALLALKCTANLVELGNEEAELADVDINGTIDAADALKILEYVAGINSWK